jgi:hypothetical protein
MSTDRNIYLVLSFMALATTALLADVSNKTLRAISASGEKLGDNLPNRKRTFRFSKHIDKKTESLLSQIQSINYVIKENDGYCKKNVDIFGYADFGRIFMICTDNIKASEYNMEYYVKETIWHEAVHVAHFCNGNKAFGISRDKMQMSEYKTESIANSMKTSTATREIEHEAYWMEDKPNEVLYVLKRYCQAKYQKLY